MPVKRASLRRCLPDRLVLFLFLFLFHLFVLFTLTAVLQLAASKKSLTPVERNVASMARTRNVTTLKSKAAADLSCSTFTAESLAVHSQRAISTK